MVKKFIPPGILIEKVYSVFILLYIIILIFFGKNISNGNLITIGTLFSTGIFILSTFRRQIVVPKWISLFFLLYLFASILSLVGSINIYPGMVRVLEIINFIYMIFIIFTVLDSKEKILWLLNSFTLVFAIFTAFGIFQYIKHPTVIYGLNFKDLLSEPVGWFKTEAILIFLFIPYTLIKLIHTKNIKSKFLFSLLLLIFSTGLVLTHAKEFWIVAAISSLYLLWVEQKNILLNWKWVTSIAIMILISINIINHLLPNTTTKLTTYNVAATTEIKDFNQLIEVYKVDLKIFAQYPLFGSGSNTFDIAYKNKQSSSWNYTSNGMNEILQNFAETGILGGIAFFLAYVYIFRFAFRNKAIIRKNPISLAILTTILCILLYSLLSNDIRSYSIFISLSILLGLFYKQLSLDNKILINTYNFPLKLKYLYILLSFLFLLGAIYIFYTGNIYSKLIDATNNKDAENVNFYGNSLINFNPFYSDTYNVMATYYADLKKPDNDKAIKYLLEARKYNPNDPELGYNLATAYYYNNNYKDATSTILQTINLGKYNNPKYYLLLGVIYEGQQKYSQAQILYSTAIKKTFAIDKNFNNFIKIYQLEGYSNSLGTMYLQEGILTQDNKMIKQAVKLNPGLVIFK